jgi:hypothetical protein
MSLDEVTIRPDGLAVAEYTCPACGASYLRPAPRYEVGFPNSGVFAYARHPKELIRAREGEIVGLNPEFTCFDCNARRAEATRELKEGENTQK